MGVIHLHSIEGYRPLADIGELDRLLLGKSPPLAIAARNEVAHTKKEFESRLRNERQALRQQQGFVPFIGDLAVGLRKLKPPSVIAEGLGQTALTDVFRDKYSVDIDSMIQKEGTLRLYARTSPLPGLEKNFTLQYQIYDKERQEEGVKTFWLVNANGLYGFANMHCLTTPFSGQVPLEGAGNITFVPGVEEALVADVVALGDIANKRNRRSQS
jgi:hypothetical protein